MMYKIKDGSYVLVKNKFHSTEYWYDKAGKPHKDNGLPAVTSTNGYEAYYTHGKLTRNKYATGVLEYID